MRPNALNDRHRALGCDLDPAWSWNEMVIPQIYTTDPQDETVAVRTRAGLFDVTMLKIVNVSGPQALEFLNGLVTSDLAKVPAGGSLITTIVNDDGGIVDDILIYVDGPETFRVSHGGGITEEVFAQFSAGHDVRWARDEDVHILSLQGPVALPTLLPHTTLALGDLAYFGHAPATLFGRTVRIGRGGYSGERGYEVFCTAADAPFLWDAILEAGRAQGVIAVSWGCLDIVRVESALLFFPFDMPDPDTTPWETKQHWAVDLRKPAFRGRDALVARRGQERTLIAGIEVLHDGAVSPGAALIADGQPAGVVTSTTWSRYLMKSLGLAAVKPAFTALGTKLEVGDGEHTFAARVVATPFYDPLRLRTHPRG